MLSYNNWTNTDLNFHVLKSLAFWCLKLQCRWKVAIRKIETKTVGFLWRERRVWADYRPTCLWRPLKQKIRPAAELKAKYFTPLLSVVYFRVLHCLVPLLLDHRGVQLLRFKAPSRGTPLGTQQGAIPQPKRWVRKSSTAGGCRWAVWKGVVCIQLACHLLSPGADVWLDEKVEDCKQRSNFLHSGGSHQFRVGASVSCNHNFFFLK